LLLAKKRLTPLSGATIRQLLSCSVFQRADAALHADIDKDE
jgi:hypothetical protein